MRDYQSELESRVEFIRNVLRDAHCDGIVYANSGGKDCTLVSILCKRACDNVLGVMLPCGSKQNYGSDIDDAKAAAAQFEIENITVDLSAVKTDILTALNASHEVSEAAQVNIAPRLRMTAIYAIAQTRNSLVAGTGNLSERTMGYFTKHGDGACDFNPIADLTATEVFEFLRFLGAPPSVINKAPSAGLYEGQTDEKEMGISYADIDRYIKTGEGGDRVIEKIETAKKRSAHKLELPKTYK